MLTRAVVKKKSGAGIFLCGTVLMAISIINDILDLSKIEKDRIELEEIDFDICQLEKYFSSLMGSMASRKGLYFLSAFSGDIPRMLRGDPGRLRQVIINILNNALKFTCHGGIMFKAELEQKYEKSCVIRFEVEDTGTGIPDEFRDTIFKPFSQADSSTARIYGGTGL